jgi:hypothetical protein
MQQMRCFCAALELGSFTAASQGSERNCGVSSVALAVANEWSQNRAAASCAKTVADPPQPP